MTGFVRIFGFAFLLFVFVAPGESFAQEPTWSPFVIMRGQDRTELRAKPMHERPYRPFHFYGNTVRRRHHRGNPLPLPRDFVQGTAAFVLRRQ
ncbi:MAG: hypothetical protein ACR2NP_20105 [Pirellulaceae bacterium]